jgi:hypothetical protein
MVLKLINFAILLQLDNQGLPGSEWKVVIGQVYVVQTEEEKIILLVRPRDWGEKWDFEDSPDSQLKSLNCGERKKIK